MREPLLATNRQVMAAMVAAGRMWMRKRRMNSERAPVNVSGTLTEAIETLWEIKRNYTVEEIADRASRVLTRAVENGISHLRTHVDVDPIGGTRPAEGLIRARERFRGLIEI